VEGKRLNLIVAQAAAAGRILAREPRMPKRKAAKRSAAPQAGPLTLGFASQRAFETWLGKHHASSAGLWLKLAKKSAGPRSITYDEALDVALCWGWIDAQKKALDDAFWLQRFCPRTRTSRWSKRNREHVERLAAAGRMKAQGAAEVERARADGRWEAAYDSASRAGVPEDLASALAANKRASAAFAALDARNRYAVLYRVQTVKRAETRAARIDKFVAMLARGERLHP
jgi:uncharacterized protein YdeI (YjbR/CyaY-like superfamily)